MRLRRGVDRRGRQRRRRLLRNAADAQALPWTGEGSGAQKRLLTAAAATTTPCATAASTTAASASSCRWPACASCTAPAGACRSASRWSASPKRKASATRRRSSARARWSATSTRPGSTSSTPTASRCATRCSTPACASTTSATLRRDPSRYLGFVEVHIEQGPVLNELDLPLGVVTSINGGVRYVGEVIGMASHAGTTPMDRRRDAATAVAELALYLEQRAAARAEPGRHDGHARTCRTARSTWCPGRCQFSLDIRATTDAVRDACAHDVLAELQRDLRAARPALHDRGDDARRRRAVRARRGSSAGSARSRRPACRCFRMPSGAGHDAMKLHEVMPQAHAVRARRERRHQPQPARIDHQRRHPARASRRSPACSTSWPPNDR